MYSISTDPHRLDIPLIHRYLAKDSYWATDIPLETVERSVANSLCFGVYAPDGAQVAFARVITDRATFAWLCDVFVLPEFQGQGISKQLMREVWSHPDIRDVRRQMLATLDAHGLYEQFGFRPIANPERYMEVKRSNPYGVPTGN